MSLRCFATMTWNIATIAGRQMELIKEKEHLNIEQRKEEETDHLRT